MVRCVGLVSAGSMGAAVGWSLVAAGTRVVAVLHDRSPATAEALAAAAAGAPAGTIVDANAISVRRAGGHDRPPEPSRFED